MARAIHDHEIPLNAGPPDIFILSERPTDGQVWPYCTMCSGVVGDFHVVSKRRRNQGWQKQQFGAEDGG
eukprot:982730-Lingulodinium_polyedra.AAC.1